MRVRARVLLRERVRTCVRVRVSVPVRGPAFSRATFHEQQDNSLQDYIESSLMLQFN